MRNATDAQVVSAEGVKNELIVGIQTRPSPFAVLEK